MADENQNTHQRIVPETDLPDQLIPILGDHMRAVGLSDIERIMLACDGTFTFQLEAFVRESIEVDILAYEEAPLTKNAAAVLGGEPGRTAWDRKVLLIGAESREPYVYAHTHLDAGSLPPALQADLKSSPAGIGRLFVDYRLSIYRELVGYYFEDGAPYAHLFPTRKDLSFLARVYRVHFDDRPVMIITEKMPRDLFVG